MEQRKESFFKVRGISSAVVVATALLSASFIFSPFYASAQTVSADAPVINLGTPTLSANQNSLTISGTATGRREYTNECEFGTTAAKAKEKWFTLVKKASALGTSRPLYTNYELLQPNYSISGGGTGSVPGWVQTTAPVNKDCNNPGGLQGIRAQYSFGGTIPIPAFLPDGTYAVTISALDEGSGETITKSALFTIDRVVNEPPPPPSGTMTANPNPCTVTWQSDGICASRLTWTTKGVTRAEVWVGGTTPDPGAELGGDGLYHKLLGDATAYADWLWWLKPQYDYKFELFNWSFNPDSWDPPPSYNDPRRGSALATLVVRAKGGVMSADNLSPVIPAGQATTTVNVTWNTWNIRRAGVYVVSSADPQGLIKYFGDATSYTQAAPWVQPGIKYDFYLYDFSDQQTSLPSIWTNTELKIPLAVVSVTATGGGALPTAKLSVSPAQFLFAANGQTSGSGLIENTNASNGSSFTVSCDTNKPWLEVTSCPTGPISSSGTFSVRVTNSAPGAPGNYSDGGVTIRAFPSTGTQGFDGESAKAIAVDYTVPSPTVDLRVNSTKSLTVNYGETVDLTWTSQNAGALVTDPQYTNFNQTDATKVNCNSSNQCKVTVNPSEGMGAQGGVKTYKIRVKGITSDTSDANFGDDHVVVVVGDAPSGNLTVDNHQPVIPSGQSLATVYLSWTTQKVSHAEVWVHDQTTPAACASGEIKNSDGTCDKRIANALSYQNYEIPWIAFGTTYTFRLWDYSSGVRAQQLGADILVVATKAGPPAPAAQLTVNGATTGQSVNATVGDPVTFRWVSTDGTRGNLTYMIDGPTACSGETTRNADGTVGPLRPSWWYAPAGLSGSWSESARDCAKGHTYTYTYTVTQVSDTLGQPDRTASSAVGLQIKPPVSVAGFSLDATDSQTVNRGSSATYTVTANRFGGFSSPITLTVPALPSSVSIDQAQSHLIIQPGEAGGTIVLRTSESTPLTTYTFTIRGSGGAASFDVLNRQLVVTAQPSFDMTVTPSVSVPQGGWADYAINLSLLNGWNKPITVTSTSSLLPPGVNARIAQDRFDPPFAASSIGTLLTLETINGITPPGTYSDILIVTATSNGQTKTARVTLIVTDGPNYSVHIAPASTSTIQGGSAAYDIEMVRSGGWSQPVALSASPPGGSGITAEFSPSTYSGSTLVGRMTLRTASGFGTPLGRYAIPVIAQSPGMIDKTIGPAYLDVNPPIADLGVAFYDSAGSGYEPFTPIFTADVSGGGTGDVTYYFWKDCPNTGTDLNAAIASGCGQPSQIGPTNTTTQNWTPSPYAARSTLYKAKVLVNRGAAWKQAQLEISVSQPPPGPTVTLAPNPLSGPAPLATTQAATVTNSAGTLITYRFWRDCTDTSTSTTACGGETAEFGTSTPYFIWGNGPPPGNPPIVYSSPGTYHPRVVIEQGASKAVAVSTVTVGNTPNTPPFGNLETPAANTIVSGSVSVGGWAIDKETTSANLTLALLIDGSPTSATFARTTRNDVCTYYPTYPGCAQSGFLTTWNTAGLSGQHTVAVRVTDGNGGTVILGPVTVTVGGGTTPGVSLVVNNGQNPTVNTMFTMTATVNNAVSGFVTYRFWRDCTATLTFDACGSTTFDSQRGTPNIAEVGLDTNAGRVATWQGVFYATAGSHTAAVVAKQGTNPAMSDTKPVTVDPGSSNTAPFGNLEAPSANATVNGSVQVSGWAIDKETTSGSLILALLIDGSPVSVTFARSTRSDVCAAYPQTTYPGSCQSGFAANWNSLSVANGPHTIAVRITDGGGMSATLGPRTVTVNNVSQQDFSLGINPSSNTTAPGVATPAYGITLSRQNGYSQSVNLSLVGLPAGWTSNFSQNPITNSGAQTSNLTITPSASAAAQTYTFFVKGAGTSFGEHSYPITLTVGGGGGGDFSLTITPLRQSIPMNTPRTFDVFRPQDSLSGQVALSLFNVPESYLSVAVSPSSIGPNQHATITVRPIAGVGTTKTFKVHGANADGSKVHEYDVTVDITAQPSFIVEPDIVYALPGATQQFNAYLDGELVTLTAGWSSSNPVAAAPVVTTPGAFTAGPAGSSTITARLGGRSATAVFNVQSVRGTKYVCSDPRTNACTQDPNGFYGDLSSCTTACRTGGLGPRYICADPVTHSCRQDASNGIYPDATSCSAACVLTPPAGLAVTPSQVSKQVGSSDPTAQFTATYTDRNGFSTPVTNSVTWSADTSSGGASLGQASPGAFTCLTPGSAGISARFGSLQSNQATLNCTAQATHLACDPIAGACTRVNGAGGNLDGCVNINDRCGSGGGPPPSCSTFAAHDRNGNTITRVFPIQNANGTWIPVSISLGWTCENISGNSCEISAQQIDPQGAPIGNPTSVGSNLPPSDPRSTSLNRSTKYTLTCRGSSNRSTSKDATVRAYGSDGREIPPVQ